ncbi:MAG: hypothetical protein ACFFAU_01370 [Candidatus Hodarchaeota archaeon]
MTREQLFQSFLEFAKMMGKLEAGQKNIEKELTNHLSSHRFDKLFYILVIAVQVITFILLKVKL